MKQPKAQPATSFIALLRAVNVGGTNAILMKDLLALSVDLGLDKVRTYIQSGNLVFESSLPEEKLRISLEKALAKKMGKTIDVMLRSAPQMQSVLDANPFSQEQPSKVAVLFFSEPLPKGSLDGLVAPGGERVHLGKREVFIYYPDGMGRSKLKIPPRLGKGTARNINTLTKLVAMATAS